MTPIDKDSHPDIAWILEKEGNGLWDYQTAGIFKVLIEKINELNQEVDSLRKAAAPAISKARVYGGR